MSRLSSLSMLFADPGHGTLCAAERHVLLVSRILATAEVGEVAAATGLTPDCVASALNGLRDCGWLPAAPGAPQGSRAEGFVEFWAAWPPWRRQARAQALAQWRRLAPDAALRATIMGALAVQAAGPDWQPPRHRYVPHAWRWLRDRRWEDELPTSVPGDPYARFPRVEGGRPS